MLRLTLLVKTLFKTPYYHPHLLSIISATIGAIVMCNITGSLGLPTTGPSALSTDIRIKLSMLNIPYMAHRSAKCQLSRPFPCRDTAASFPHPVMLCSLAKMAKSSGRLGLHNLDTFPFVCIHKREPSFKYQQVW